MPLPEGKWELTQTTTILRNGFDWKTFVFRNTQAELPVAYMVIRYSTKNYQWGDTVCKTDKGNPSAFMVNDHHSVATQLVNKCSRLFALDNFEYFLQAKITKESDYWKNTLPGLVQEGKPQHQGMLMAEMRVQGNKRHAVEVSLFIHPPNHLQPSAFRDSYKARNLSAEHQILENWLSIYVELIEQGTFFGAPEKLLALQYPVGTKLANADGTKPPQVTPASQAASAATIAAASTPTKPASVAIAASSTSSATEAAKMDAERKAIEKDKLELAQQLEKMQQMLAQLQKANADAAQAAQLAQAAQAAQAASAAALAAASTPAKPAVPQVFANRKALVIGNDLYTDVSKLNNAGADAEAMAKALADVGYQVTKHLNVSEKAFKVALRDFRAKVQGGDEVLFFYAGHGVQLANANYLLPVDIKGDSEEQIKDDAIQLQRFLEDMQDKKTKFALAVIDACRDNPFKGQGRAIGGRGLAPTTAATGQMVMFSAGSGQQALDKLGPKDPDKNGLFTRIFVKEMRKPGVSVDRVLRNVRNQVVEQAKSVGHEQTPALYDQSIGEFYFLN